MEESGAQGQGIRTAYGVIPNYLEGEKAGSRTSDPTKEEVGSDVISSDNVKKEANIKMELEEEVSSS